ncbi:MAG TPA: nucleotidyltransferase family protein [Niallia sp.]|nr:nucleotidyltransferase family protein [Niallia sp.]
MGSKQSLDFTHVPRELKLIIEILMKEKEYFSDNNKDLFININWNLFLELAFHHRIYPSLYVKLKDYFTNLVPKHVMQTLAMEYKNNTIKMLCLSAELEEINTLFTKNNVQSIFLKGPVLAKQLYGDISNRTSSDIDLLVRIDDLNQVDGLLKKKGYQKEDEFLAVFDEWKWRNHHISYFHPRKQTLVEIHWRLSPGPKKESSFEELWRRKSTVYFAQNPIHTLGKEDLFLFLVTHGARHGWSRLRWLVDIHNLIKDELNWGELQKLLKRYQNIKIAGQAVILVNELFDTEFNVGQPWLINNRSLKLAQDAVFYLERMININAIPVPADIRKYHKSHLYSLMSFKHRIIFLLSIMYPSHLDAVTLPLPKYLHFLYFPLRPILWICRKSKKPSIS